MDKKYFIILALLLGCTWSYGQQNIGCLYDEFSRIDEVGRMHMNLSLHTETARIETIDISNFEDCTPQVKERFAAAVGKVKDPAYETLLTAQRNHTRMRVLIRIKKEMIREIVILTTGQKNSIVRIQGAIKKSEVENVIESYGYGC